MTKQKVFVTRRRVPDAIALLEQHFEVEVWGETSPPPREVVLEKVNKVQGMLTEVDDIVDEEVLSTAKALKIVANRAVGLDNIDLGSATRHRVLISNTPGVLHESCADFTFALILALARNVAFGDREIRAGRWTVFDQMPYLGTDVYGMTLGILGLGRIGQAVARRAVGFDMNVVYFSRSRRPDDEKMLGLKWASDLTTLLRESDYVSVHVPLNDGTRHFIGEEQLALMKPNAFLINTSRGGTVDP